MNQEPRKLTDNQLEFSIQNQITTDKQQRIIEESNILELKRKFNLSYVRYDDYSISIESENFAGYVIKHTEPEMKMLCKLDEKDITTFEEFQAAKNIIAVEKQNTLDALNWIADIIFINKD